MSLMWMPAQTTVPPLSDGAQRHRHERADRREDQRRVERLGRRLVGAARPAAPSVRANACAALSPGRVKAKTSRP